MTMLPTSCNYGKTLLCKQQRCCEWSERVENTILTPLRLAQCSNVDIDVKRDLSCDPRLVDMQLHIMRSCITRYLDFDKLRGINRARLYIGNLKSQSCKQAKASAERIVLDLESEAMGGLGSIPTRGNILSLNFFQVVRASDANIGIIANFVYL